MPALNEDVSRAARELMDSARQIAVQTDRMRRVYQMLEAWKLNDGSVADDFAEPCLTQFAPTGVDDAEKKAKLFQIYTNLKAIYSPNGQLNQLMVTMDALIAGLG
jgi:hypothetical protein